ncbi:galactoside binding lectin-like [Scleropages formosus]|nr:galactoside binding lectin-like [Scleropages formosus]
MSFKVGQTLTITGVAKPDATNFAVNVGHGEDNVVLHLNPRFDAHGDQRTVVCNSYQGGNWCEELREGNFPFQQGEEFKIMVTFTSQEFQVTLPDGFVIQFPNRSGDEKFQYMNFDGEMRVHSIEIK